MSLATIIFSSILTVAGLCLFEVVNSLDNAVVNSGVLARIRSAKARRFFLTGGVLISVFVVRGLAPFLIYYVPNYKLGLATVFRSFFTSDPGVRAAVAAMTPNLLMAGGMFLALLFLHWLLAEDKDLGYAFEIWLSKQGAAWFFGAAGVLLVVVEWLVKSKLAAADPARAMNLMLAAAIGVAAFFVVDGFKEYAETTEEKLLEGSSNDTEPGPALSDWAKVLFLEVIDASFSVDGVVGAFAFTTTVPLILVGNGIGAYIVRRLTLSGTERICQYKLLANGAFYSIGLLGTAMVAEGFGVAVPGWVSPVVTFALVGWFLVKSIRLNKAEALAACPAGTVVQ